MAFLSAVVGVQDSTGTRVDSPDAQGNYLPIVLKIGTNITPTATQSGGVSVVTLAAAGGVTSVSGTAPIASSGGATPAISITAASGSAAGSMSAAHYSLVNAATDAATASALVKRDGSSVSKLAAIGLGATPATTGQIRLTDSATAIRASVSGTDRTVVGTIGEDVTLGSGFGSAYAQILDGGTEGFYVTDPTIVGPSGTYLSLTSALVGILPKVRLYGGATKAATTIGDVGLDATGRITVFADGSQKTVLVTGDAAGVTSVSGTAPIASSGGATPAISIGAASAIAAGSQSAAHFTLVDGATSAATVSTLAKRDAAGRVKAAAGVASDDVAVVSQLGGASIVAPSASALLWVLDEVASPFLQTGKAVSLDMTLTGVGETGFAGPLGDGVWLPSVGVSLGTADTAEGEVDDWTWHWWGNGGAQSSDYCGVGKVAVTGAAFAIALQVDAGLAPAVLFHRHSGSTASTTISDQRVKRALMDGAWHHVALSFDGSVDLKFRIYVDGSLVWTSAAQGAVVDWGAHRAYWVPGTYGIQRIVLEPSVLTAAAIREIATKGLAWVQP
ncbi:MAG: LamG-like jellyroll fold domain-containing protein [Deltaproteobacteria bacterium]